MTANGVRSERAAGAALAAAALAALLLANSPLAPAYSHLLALRIGPGSILRWIDEGLMAVFFLRVGLELKAEMLSGVLSSSRDLTLPLAAAAGGMAAPAAVYVILNHGDPSGMRGWAISSATDIAFALAALSIAGSRLPRELKVLLTAIAILDDLGAIAVIGLFYTGKPSAPMLAAAIGCFAAIGLLNRAGVKRAAPYLLLGALMWVCVARSGVHATLAGVATAFGIPFGPRGAAPAAGERLERALQPWVDFGILPLFGLANGGLVLAGFTPAWFGSRITLGIVLGLVLGKPIGVCAGAWLAVRTRLARAPAGTSATMWFGLACLCGIGFTMSLFIGALAFGEHGAAAGAVKLGVLAGSLCSAAAGCALLACAQTRSAASAPGGV